MACGAWDCRPTQREGGPPRGWTPDSQGHAGVSREPPVRWLCTLLPGALLLGTVYCLHITAAGGSLAGASPPRPPTQGSAHRGPPAPPAGLSSAMGGQAKELNLTAHPPWMGEPWPGRHPLGMECPRGPGAQGGLG